MRLFFFLSLILSLFIGIQTTQAASSCDNTTATCEDACSNIYDTCSISINNSSGSAMLETECVSACASTDAAVITCLASVSCTASAVDNCLTYASSSTSTEDEDSTYVGGSGVEDSEGTTTSGGSCGTISDCNSCISNCRCRYGGTAAASTCCTGCGCECELYCMPTEWWVATCI